MIKACAMTHVGLVRSNNEDRFISNPELGLFVVADGMGGLQGGETASRITVETISSEIERAGPGSDMESLVEAVRLANRNVRCEAEKEPSHANMGTTVVAVLLATPKVYLANVGDSRAYLRSDGRPCSNEPTPGPI